jgi:RNA polymerase sigma-70 factor (ECF subfamily)
MKDLDEKAVRLVVEKQTNIMAAISTVQRSDNYLAQGVFSDTAIEIGRSWDKFDNTREFLPWATTIAKRIAANHLRSAGRERKILEQFSLDSIASEVDELGGESVQNLRIDALTTCVSALPAFYREVIRLRYYENHSCEQITQMVQKTAGALNTLLSRLHRRLGQCVNKKVKI